MTSVVYKRIASAVTGLFLLCIGFFVIGSAKFAFLCETPDSPVTAALAVSMFVTALAGPFIGFAVKKNPGTVTTVIWIAWITYLFIQN